MRAASKSKLTFLPFTAMNGIIIKLLIKNILEKKLRTFLIVFSATAACALVFTAISLSGTIKNIYEQQLRKYVGTADIMIYANKSSPSTFVGADGLKNYTDKMEYYVGCVTGEAIFKPTPKEEVRISVLGCEYEGLQKFNPVVLTNNKELDHFSGRVIIVGKAFAEKYHLSEGQSIPLLINNSRHYYRIVGIGEAQGFLIEDSFNTYVIVPENTLSAIYDQKGNHTVIYAKVNTGVDTGDLVKEISGIFKRYAVEEVISREELENSVASLSSILMLMSLLVYLMSFFIIYSSFKVIILERFSVVGTLRSIGATEKTARRFLLSESLLYALTGTIMGIALGAGVVYVIAQLSKSPWMRPESVKLDINPWSIILSLVFTIVICIASSFAPIMKLTRLPVKEIILNEVKWGQSRKKASKVITGIVFIAIIIVVPPVCPPEYFSSVAIVLIIFSLTGSIMLIPGFTGLLAKALQVLYIKIFGNIGFLAAKNLRGSKLEINNISLLAVGLSVMLMVNILSGNLTREMLNFYSEGNFDISVLNGENMDRDFIMELNRSQGVGDICGVYNRANVKVNNKNDKIALLSGIDTNQFLDFWEIGIEGNYDLLQKLNEGRYILLSTMHKGKFNIEKGEQVVLDIEGKNRSYTVLGFFSSMRNMGDYALISDKYYKLDTGERFYSELYIKTASETNSKEIAENIGRIYTRKSVKALTLDQLKKIDEEQIKRIFVILKIFSGFAMLIGVIGIVNNLAVSFIQRKLYLAVQKSIGMSKRQIVEMIMIEALSGGFIGSVAGVAVTALMIWIIGYFLPANNINIEVSFKYDMSIMAIGGGILLMLTASVSPVLKSTQINIIEAIKYE